MSRVGEAVDQPQGGISGWDSQVFSPRRPTHRGNAGYRAGYCRPRIPSPDAIFGCHSIQRRWQNRPKGNILGVRKQARPYRTSCAKSTGAVMDEVRKALKMHNESLRRRALAPAYDPVRRDFDCGLADAMEREARELLMPAKPLQTGLGGEIIPPVETGLAGLESVLKEPDLLDLGASVQRAQLLDRNDVLELGIETAEDAQAQGAIQKMVSHQLAAGHKRAMELLEESARAKDPDIAIKKARASARLMDAFSRSALTLQRLQRGSGQTIQVQYMQVNAMVGDASGKVQNPSACVPANRGGRPPTSGYRTQEAIRQRSADRDLVSRMERIGNIG